MTANLLLNVYGMHPVNFTVDLCSILGGALCPLPMYNFTGSDSIPLPSSLNVVNKIPRVAFKIPDLEGYAQLLLTEVGTGDIKACIQATLSNGWSTRQLAVAWVTGGIALATLLAAICFPFATDGAFLSRILDLLHLCQFIATTSFLGLNYPSLYRAYTLNFAWSIGLFSPFPTLQHSIDRMRQLTHGKLAYSTSAAAVGFVNRRLSPYNDDGSGATVLSPAQGSIASFITVSRSRLFGRAADATGVQTVTPTSQNVLQAGIPIYVNSINIPTANAFMTLFLCVLLLLACGLAAFAIAHVLFSLGKRLDREKQDHKLQATNPHRSSAHAWSIRLVIDMLYYSISMNESFLMQGLLLLSPISILSFYQWTLRDSWLSILLSVIAFLATLSLVLYPVLVTFQLVHRTGSPDVLSHPHYIASNAPLYGQYRPERFYFFLPLLFASVLRAAIIAFVNRSGEAQVILMVILEGLILITYLILRPYKRKRDDVFSSFLAAVRLICTGLMIAFIEHLDVNPIPRVVIGVIIAVILSIALLITYLNLLIDCGIHRLWNRSTPVMSQSSGNDLMVESEHGTRSNSSDYIGRPINPTPEHRVPLDSEFLQPYPTSPTDTERPSADGRDSVTLTVGSLVSRRWSFSPLSSPTGTVSVEHRLSTHMSSDHHDH